jgi:hypothetical protein
MLVGNILSVQWPEVWLTAAIYVAIALFSLCTSAIGFLEISMDAKARLARGVPVSSGTILFYASFGFVVTRSWRLPACCLCLLLSHRAVGRRHAVLRQDRPEAGSGWWQWAPSVSRCSGCTFQSGLTCQRARRLSVRSARRSCEGSSAAVGSGPAERTLRNAK